MTTFRLSALAEADIADVLATSEELWGRAARRRYEAIIATAMRMVAANPAGRATRDRAELSAGLRSLHIRFAHPRGSRARVRHPVHVLYYHYRPVGADLIEIVRVLHERMEPSQHLPSDANE